MSHEDKASTGTLETNKEKQTVLKVTSYTIVERITEREDDKTEEVNKKTKKRKVNKKNNQNINVHYHRV